MLRLTSLSNNSDGFSVVKIHGLRDELEKMLILHGSRLIGKQFNSISNFCESAPNYFEKLRHKTNRIFPEDMVVSLIELINKNEDLRIPEGGFITDEEELGYPNIYWRIVRSNTPTDVGSVHADAWFWDLGHGNFPKNYSRVKVWLPIEQDNANPSLLILPKSHLANYKYDYIEDDQGKRRPQFLNKEIIDQLIPAQVKTGEAIVFNDKLLHGGQSVSRVRVSMEWTCGIPNF
jgi:hypothetical protein